ncbi:MAG: glycerol-3-phosphate dehydrogenase/oxidase, partial [Candidatus Omnitrophica bacterium]|nr:glycerol-3-phosphate dehydrogenase/oxidase [Candidatus Omnitrophota bacterium]
GGGIVGAGIARDATLRGLRVALIEQGDFASGTSSKTSKLIHGGLRYLEQGRVSLVRQGLRERMILRTIAPSVVKPLPILIPVYRGNSRSLWKVRAGLWLYHLLAARNRMGVHRMYSARRALTLEPSLKEQGLQGVGCYSDCIMNDARLCLANVLQATLFGAACANYIRLRSFLKSEGKIRAAVAEDVFTGKIFEIRASAFVNAAGPWADSIRRLSDDSCSARLAPTKGIHLLVPRLSHEALFTEARFDQRMFFVLPWGETSLVGTTEKVTQSSLEALSADGNEVSYLLEKLNYLFPGRRLGPEDVVATFAGARPLLAFSGSSTQASREHRIEVDGQGLVSILGGKFTTFRLMAQQTVDFLVRQFRWQVDACITHEVSLMEEVAPPVWIHHWKEATQLLSQETLARLLLQYGAAVVELLKLIAEDKSLAQPICCHQETLGAEIAHGFRSELACTLTDVLARRTQIAWAPCHGLDAAATCVAIAQRWGQLSSEAAQRQLAQYHAFIEQGLAFRRSSTMAAR